VSRDETELKMDEAARTSAHDRLLNSPIASIPHPCRAFGHPRLARTGIIIDQGRAVASVPCRTTFCLDATITVDNVDNADITRGHP
jgi:hypothetical protein